MDEFRAFLVDQRATWSTSIELMQQGRIGMHENHVDITPQMIERLTGYIEEIDRILAKIDARA